MCGVYCEEDDDRVCAACKAEKKNHYCPECAAKWADEAFAAVRMVKADEIDRLTRENADLRARLANAEKVIADYTATIREYMAREKAATATHGQPMAWAVFLPKGEEYDYAVFGHVEDAKQQAEILDADEEEGAEPRGVMPLYADPGNAIASAEKACDEQAEAVRVLAAECEMSRVCVEPDPIYGWDEPRHLADHYMDWRELGKMREQTDANPIAAAAVEGKETQ
mgnify:FL=1